MKKHVTIIFFFLTFFLHSNLAQVNCSTPSATEAVSSKNIRALMSTGGYLFRDNDSNFAQFQAPYLDSGSPASIFSAGLWMGGFTGLPNNPNLKLAVVDYPSTFDSYLAGPLSDIGTLLNDSSCLNYDKIWTVSKAEIEAHQQDFADNGVIDNPIPNVVGFPAKDNPNFSQVNGFDLPPGNMGYNFSYFHDELPGTIDEYNALDGDYPVVFRNKDFLPSQMSYAVFNTIGLGIGEALRFEVHLTMWTMECPTMSILDNTVFARYRFVNREQTPLDSLHVGMWVDFDLGCFTDDYVGSVPDLSTFYVYNQSDIDGDGGCGFPVTDYGDTPPVQAVTFLDVPMDHFATYGGFNAPPATADPSQPAEYFNYLSGSWRDGTPFTNGGTGYNPTSTDITSHLFSGDPNDANSWALENTGVMDDYRAIGSYQYKDFIGNTQLGSLGSFEMTMAFTFHQGDGLGRLENVTLMKDEVQKLKDWYERMNDPNDPLPACANITSIANVQNQETISVFPNPNSGTFQLDFPKQKIQEIQVFDVSGKLIWREEGNFENQKTIHLQNASSGIYFLRGKTEEGFFHKKLMVN